MPHAPMAPGTDHVTTVDSNGAIVGCVSTGTRVVVLNQTHLENRNFVAGDPEDLTPARSGAFTRSPSPSMGRGRCERAK
jgi:hypothetical protein